MKSTPLSDATWLDSADAKVRLVVCAAWSDAARRSVEVVEEAANSMMDGSVGG